MRLEVVGKNHLVREATASLLASRKVFASVSQTDDFSGVMQRLRRRKSPTLILVHLLHATEETARLLHGLSGRGDHLYLVLLGDSARCRRAGMRFLIDGAHGYLSAAESSLEDLYRMAEFVASGKRNCAPDVLEMLIDYYVELYDNPPREYSWVSPQNIKLLRFLEKGLTYAEIAEEFHLGRAAIRKRVQKLAHGLGFERVDRRKIVREARRLQWL